MSESKGSRFLRYFPLVLDALRSAYPTAMRPSEVRAWIRSKIEVPADELSRLVENGSQSIFEDDVHWARFYLVKGNLIDSRKRGFWGLTPEGLATRLSPDETWSLYVRIRDANRPGAIADEGNIPAPDTAAEGEDGEAYWFAGTLWGGTDEQMPRFLAEGIWESGYDEKFSELIRRIKAGDRIATKTSFVQKRGLPFDVGGRSISVMRIKATGTVLQNLNNGRTVKVAWDPSFKPRDWYFYTFRTTIVEADIENEDARHLVDFAFRGIPQDYRWFLDRPYWVQKYGSGPSNAVTELPKAEEAEVIAADDQPTYTINDIIDDGSFLTAEELQTILDRWRSKKNLVLQGPPGTGKTWLAKRLGFALVGSRDRETARSRLRVVQFHPSLSYEDFVRGWRPAGDGRLSLIDGILSRRSRSQ
jgi:5-methylcytosine-specific restriction enzyme B